ncbi:MAG: phospholipid carrier-dependent glycosyltransferase [Anaeromyxobacteraceae bacterium]
MTRRDFVQMGLLFVLAFALRFHDLGRPPTRWQDENSNMAGAINYWEAGRFEPDTWEHPPLRNLSGYAFIKLLGDNPYGWRMRNVLFGSAAAVLAWLFGFRVGGRRVALITGILVATDPLHVVLSRFTFEEVYGGTFFLGAAVLFAFGRHRTPWLVASALLLGCALATKWYYAPAWLLMLALLLLENSNYRRPGTALFLLCCWTAIPVTVYAATYGPWFGRGYRLAELPEFVLNAYSHLQAMNERYVQVVDQRRVFQNHTSALEWFLRPIWIGDGKLLGADRGVFLLYVNDLPIWGFTLPAVAATAVLAWRVRRLDWAMPALYFAAMYLLFLPVERATFIYSALPLLPFAFAAIALLLDRCTDRLPPQVHWGIAGILLAWNLYLYPLVTAHPIPVALYRWLLVSSELAIH